MLTDGKAVKSNNNNKNRAGYVKYPASLTGYTEWKEFSVQFGNAYFTCSVKRMRMHSNVRISHLDRSIREGSDASFRHLGTRV